MTDHRCPGESICPECSERKDNELRIAKEQAELNRKAALEALRQLFTCAALAGKGAENAD